MGLDIGSEVWLSDIIEDLNAICTEVDEKLENNKKQRKMCKRRIELESQHEALNQQLSELCRRHDDLDKVCEMVKTRLTIAESDQNKLENSRELFQIAKELTGIRIDFAFSSEHPDIAKGYIKNQAKRLLEPFEMKHNSDALWDQIATIFDVNDSENRPLNRQ
ncbi:unnamed protein product [Leptosia nina]|uniref:Kinetochore protein Spc24 n=1 Tax=Leptosia nina TaxID=320188 RepID=A0AAV1K4N5_9NEOP